MRTGIAIVYCSNIAFFTYWSSKGTAQEKTLTCFALGIQIGIMPVHG